MTTGSVSLESIMTRESFHTPVLSYGVRSKTSERNGELTEASFWSSGDTPDREELFIWNGDLDVRI